MPVTPEMTALQVLPIVPPTIFTADSSSRIHPGAQIGAGTVIGPFCDIGEHVKVGLNTKIMAGVVIHGHTTIGDNCQFYPYAVVGVAAQVVRPPGFASQLVIGDGTVVREHASIQAGAYEAAGTRIGRDCLIMSQVHVAHDCIVEDEVILVTGVGLAGHVRVESKAIVAGQAGVSQYVRIGRRAYIGAGSKLSRDVLPYTTVIGDRAKTVGINAEGLRRDGWKVEDMAIVANAVELLRDKDQRAFLEYLDGHASDERLKHMADFMRSCETGVCHPKSEREAAKL